MPSLAAVQSDVDAKLADLIVNQIQPQQAVFFAGRARYWQGVATTRATALPNNRAADAASSHMTPNENARPTDQTTSWATAGYVLGPTLPMSLVITTYAGNRGRGYVVTAVIKHSNRYFARAVEFHEGSRPGEPEHAYAWRPVMEDPPRRDDDEIWP